MNFFKSKILNLKSNSGYAILFTMVIISIMMTFALGASSNAVKQMILSSTATDSQIAFYQADTAGECALYIVTHTLNTLSSIVTCGTKSDGTQTQLIFDASSNPSQYSLTSDPNPGDRDPCFKIDVNTTLTPRKIEARGYNVCDPTNPRQVERGIEITF